MRICDTRPANPSGLTGAAAVQRGRGQSGRDDQPRRTLTINIGASFSDARRPSASRTWRSEWQRELIKQARLSTGLAEASRQRGVDNPASNLTAEAEIDVLKLVFEQVVTQGSLLTIADH